MKLKFIALVIALGLGQTAMAQTTNVWGCSATVPGTLPDMKLVAVLGGARSEATAGVPVVSPWTPDNPDQTVISWNQEADNLTGYTWIAISGGTETVLPAVCEISISPGTATAPPPPPPPTELTLRAPMNLKVSRPEEKPPVTVSGVVSFDSATDGGTTGTFQHTTSGNNRLLYVFFRTSNGVPSAVTYNGVAMTQVGFADGVAGDGSPDSYAFSLINPSAGTNPVAITLASGTLSGAAAISFTGAAQTTQPDAILVTRLSTADAISNITTVTPGADLLIATATYYYNYNTGVTVDSPYVNRLTTARHWKIGETGALEAGPHAVTSHGPGLSYMRQMFLIAIKPIPQNP